jgi:hypothetical protein
VFLRRLGKQLAGENLNPETNPETEAEHYEKKTRALKAEDEFHQTRDNIANPPSVREAQQKMIEDMQKRAQDAEERARDAETKARQADAEARKEAERLAAEARSEARAAEKALHDHQLTVMSQKLDEVLQSKQGLQQQFEEYFGFADQIAAKLGYQKPGMTAPASENPQIALEIAKMHIDDAQKQREHERNLEKDKREWDLKLEEIRQQNAFDAAQLKLDQEKVGMLAQLPEAIGGIILKGAMDRAKGVGQVAQRAPQQKVYKIELGVGEANEFECPNCKSAIAVGPSSVTARCLKCNTQYPIERVQTGSPPQGVQAGPPPPDEE